MRMIAWFAQCRKFDSTMSTKIKVFGDSSLEGFFMYKHFRKLYGYNLS